MFINIVAYLRCPAAVSAAFIGGSENIHPEISINQNRILL